ncbi:type VII secretion target [Micromonospora sp. NPDC005305]|uniref:type VII secretion target n=1 Tax=Micromonospora sp. NPDC005305 TaxID=3156875 RepID=UPI0033BE8EC2
MTAGFEVDTRSLRAHSSAVDETADTVDECRRASVSVELGRDAYGRLCQMIPSLLHPLQEAIADSLGETAGVLQRAADGLRTVSDRYDRGDAHVASLFGGGRR